MVIQFRTDSGARRPVGVRSEAGFGGAGSDALEHNWSRAAVNRDAAALPRFYADEYTFTNPDGVVSTKNKELADLTGGMFKLRSFKFEDMKVHIYGNVAVVTGKNTITGFWKDINKDVSGPYRFTDVFVKRNGEWRC